MAEEIAIIDGRAFTRTQYNNYVSHLGRRKHLAPAFNPIQPAVPTPPPAPATPPPPSRPTYSAPSAPPPPSVATASAVNETREAAKSAQGYQSTVLSLGNQNRRTRARTKQQESGLMKQKPTQGGTVKRKLLGSA